jgi:drug/metabolite transporter (DMT)-like permease
MPSTPPTSDRRNTLVGLGSIALAGLVWGTIPLIIRFVDGASVVKVFYRVFFAVIAIGIWMTATRQLGEIRALSRRKLLQVALQGVILTVNWTLFLTALDMTNVATAELLGYTGPVFVAALAPLVTGERFDPRVLLPLGLAMGGIVIILVPQGLHVSSSTEMLGAGLAFASALTYATLLLRSKKILRGISGGSLMLIEYTVASALLFPFVLWAYGHGNGPTGANAYWALLTLGLVHTALTGVIFLGGLRRVRTDSAAILTYAEPASAVVFAAIFLGEALTVWTIVGGVLVVAGGMTVASLAPGGTAEPIPIEAAGTEPEAR